MEPRTLFKLLLDSKFLNPDRLAREMKDAHKTESNLQTTFHRFLKPSGSTKDPRRSWTTPTAEFLGVHPDAFHSKTVAQQEAERLGLKEDGAVRQFARRAPGVTRIDPGMLAIQIGQLMGDHDDATRRAAASLFAGACEHPDNASEYAGRLRGLLAQPQKQKASGEQ